MKLLVLLIIIFLIICWLAYEMIMAPIMPDDYGLTDEERKLWKDITDEKKKLDNINNKKR